MTQRRVAITLVSITAIALTACGGGAAPSGDDATNSSNGGGEKITLTLAQPDNAGTVYNLGAEKIAEEVSAATDGQIEITVVPGGALGDERVTVEMVTAGDLDIAAVGNPVLTNWIPEMSILDQAFLWDTLDQAHAAVDGPVGELVSDAAAAQGMNVIGYMESGFRNTFSKNPIESMADFSGVKIRTMQNEYHIAAFEAFGALPVALPFGEQFTALQQGTIDAAENATTNMLANRYFEVINHHTTTEHAFVYIVLVMSDEAWESIPEDLKPAFMEAVKRGADAERQLLQEANEEAAQELKELGVEFHEIDREALKAAYQEVVEDNGFTFDPEWEAAVEAVRSES